jgi:hypothetical protein
MSLFQATLATGFALIALGLPLLLVNKLARRLAVRFPPLKTSGHRDHDRWNRLVFDETCS